MMRSAIQRSVPVLSLFVVVGAAAELFVSAGLRQDLATNQEFCRLYLCDDIVVANSSLDLRIKGDAASLSLSVQLLNDLVRRDESSAMRWLDLGDTLGQAGSIDQARFCINRARELGRFSTSALIGAGDFYLRNGDLRQGLHCLSQALSLTSERNEVIFSIFPARHASVRDVLAYGLPPQVRPAQSYFRYLIEWPTESGVRPPAGDVKAAWEWMAAHHLTGREITSEYTNFLVSRKLFQDARDVWVSQLSDRPSGYFTSQFLYNGDFEQELSLAPFDWSIDPVDHVEVHRDSKAYSGRFSLRIRFDGWGNIDYHNVAQKTVLRPGRYRLQAYIRSEDVSTDQGAFFRVSDAENPKRLSVETEQVRGTTPWHALATTFVASPATQVVEVSVARRPSAKFDNKINGAVWIDQVSLTRLE
jgi:tetratricopeptide (TPR) repeat protein